MSKAKRTDKQRLDFITGKCYGVRYFGNKAVVMVATEDSRIESFIGRTPRQAIDAAMDAKERK
jgi:hypothetical protein